MKFEVVYDSEIGAMKLIFKFKIPDKTFVIPLEEDIILRLLEGYKG